MTDTEREGDFKVSQRDRDKNEGGRQKDTGRERERE